MAQNYTSDMYDINHTVSTDMGRIENSVNTLRTNFSGAAQPSNPVAFQFWGETSSSALMIRNSANSAWINMFDLKTGAAVKLNKTVTAGTGLSGGGTLTSNLTISHSPHTGDVTGTTALTIGSAALSHNKFNKNTFIAGTGGRIEEESKGSFGWSDVNEKDYVIVPKNKGFIRMFCVLKRGSTEAVNTRGRFKLYDPLENQEGGGTTTYSSGSGDVSVTSYATALIDCGSLSLSTWSTGQQLVAQMQVYNSHADGTVYMNHQFLVWGTST